MTLSVEVSLCGFRKYQDLLWCTITMRLTMIYALALLGAVWEG